jgi:uncharacterized OB-fold protein
VPFAVGYVELEEGVRVAAVLDVEDPGELHIGMPLSVTAGAGVPRARPTTAGSATAGPTPAKEDA